MSARHDIAQLGRRAELSTAEANEVAGRIVAALLSEAEGVVCEMFDAADERGDSAGADMAEQIADRLHRMAAEAARTTVPEEVTE